MPDVGRQNRSDASYNAACRRIHIVVGIGDAGSVYLLSWERRFQIAHALLPLSQLDIPPNSRIATTKVGKRSSFCE